MLRTGRETNEGVDRPNDERPPAVAGSFYPDDPDRLRAEVDRALDAALEAPDPPSRLSVSAVIAPHAGYRYSGAVAARAFAAWRQPASADRGPEPRVVVIGPAHHLAFEGLALPSAARLRTPLGSLRVDRGAVARLVEAGAARVDDRPWEREHSVEVELPFVQRTLGAGGASERMSIVPLVTGEASPSTVATALEMALGEGSSSTALVVSSDLSHFLDRDEAVRVDRSTLDQVARLRGPLGADQACGAVAINGLLELAARRDWRAQVLAYRTSAEAGGPRDRVVGYGAVAFGEAR